MKKEISEVNMVLSCINGANDKKFDLFELQHILDTYNLVDSEVGDGVIMTIYLRRFKIILEKTNEKDLIRVLRLELY